jgi:hypothetical protein
VFGRWDLHQETAVLPVNQAAGREINAVVTPFASSLDRVNQAKPNTSLAVRTNIVAWHSTYFDVHAEGKNSWPKPLIGNKSTATR